MYLDEGFEEINPYYRIQKRHGETVFLLDEMIRQIMDKEACVESYRLAAMNGLKNLNDVIGKDTEECRKWWKRLFTTFDLVHTKITALWVEGEANFPEDHTIKDYRSADVLLKREKDVKKIESLRLEGRTLEGREDYWTKKCEEKISQLPEHSQVLFVIEARYVGFHEDSDSFDPTKEFNLPKDALVDWGVKDCRHFPSGKFHEKLGKFGKVNIVDLTQEKMKKSLEHNWKIR